jgi:hypothetical protein
MSVEQSKVVDFIGVDNETGGVVLTISDHLDWTNSQNHQAIFQDKINAYLAFVESGEILQRYPDAKGKPVALEVVFKFKPDISGLQFLAKVREVIESAGFAFKHEVFAESYDN